MPDFTSALYLGWKHPSSQIPPFAQLTTGKPSLLQEPILAKKVAHKIARLQGLETGILGRSTLHLFWDLFELFGKEECHIFFDELLYEVPKWGIQQSKLYKNPIQKFPHQQISFLKKRIRKSYLKNRKPIIICDGFCPQCGQSAPIKEYLRLLKPFGGILIIDDTQALGLLGRNASTNMPFGYNGGGVLPFQGVSDKNIISISSLAKSFGVPTALISGSFENIGYFKKKSLTRIHCSPPTFAEINALQKTLISNKIKGSKARQSLFQKVRFFRYGLKGLGFKLKRGFFPIQMILGLPEDLSNEMFQYLKRQNIYCVLLKSHLQNQATISFIINDSHSKNDLKKCLNSMEKVIFSNSFF